MVKPNSFYRFEQGWSAGFYPDNQIVSDLLNEFYVNILTAFPVIAQPGLSTIPYLNQVLNQVANGYNAYPYYGNFSVTLDLVDQVTYYDFTFTIRDEGLYSVDNTQEFTIIGQATLPGKVFLPTPVLSAFAPGSYTGTFSPTLIKEEQKISEALEVVYQNGSALFPITYSFDPSTTIATSGLARGSNWKLWNNNEPNRLPYPTIPRTNRRTFSLPELNSDDKYIVSVMERIIQASLENADYTNSVLVAINSFSVPDGWTLTISHPSFTTYERVQVSYVDNSGRRKFILVGRKDTTWLWQRFVSDDTNATYDFLTNYVETDALPYEPNQAGRWLYNDDTYDFEFVEFNSGCYESPEFYPMPAKPGDQWQFNIDKQDANIVGLPDLSVGLFSEDGQFIQKIGDTNAATVEDCVCQDCSLTVQFAVPQGQWNDYLATMSTYNDDACADMQGVIFRMSLWVDGVVSIEATTEISNPTPVFTTNMIMAFANKNPFSLELINGNYVFSCPVDFAECGKTYQLKNGVKCKGPTVPNYTEFYTSTIYECPTPEAYEPTQVQASVTIPPLSGCYRMGLYYQPGGFAPAPIDPPCELEMVIYYEWYEAEDFIYGINNLFSTPQPYVSFNRPDGSYYLFTVTSNTLTFNDIVTWCNTNIPGMNAFYDEFDTGYLRFTLTMELPCQEQPYYFSICASDVDGSCQEDEFINKTSVENYCVCGDKCVLPPGTETSTSGLYVSYTQGFDPINTIRANNGRYLTISLYDGVNRIQKHQFLIDFDVSDSDAQCYLEINSWAATIQGMTVTDLGIGNDVSFAWTTEAPCGGSYQMDMSILAIDGTVIGNIGQSFPTFCPCPPPPSEDTLYALYSLSNIINIDNSDCFSTMIEFWGNNETMVSGFEYFNDWKQRIRLGINGGGDKPVIEESLYRQSNGVHRRPQSKQDLSLDLHTDFLDLPTQLALVDATRHPYFVWNGQNVFVKGDIEVATIQDFTTQSSFETLAQVKFQVLKQGFQPKNSSCLTC